MSTYTMPPIGVKPRWVHDSQRLGDITQAIQRCIEANTQIRYEWIEEYNELIGRKQDKIESLRNATIKLRSE